VRQCRLLVSVYVCLHFTDKTAEDIRPNLVDFYYFTTAVADRSYSGKSLDSFSPVTTADVHRLLVKMPAKSSPIDIVPTSLILKACADQFAVVISRLANLSFTRESSQCVSRLQRYCHC